MKHYKVLVEVHAEYELSILAKSEEKAEEIARKTVVNGDEDPSEREIDVLDIYESPDDSE